MAEEKQPFGESQPSDFVEGSKLLHDTFKHLTTLSTGSILLMVTLIQSLFNDRSLRELQGTVFIGLSFACFIIAMLSATAIMIIIGDQMRGREFYERLPGTIWTRDFFRRFFQTELRLGALFVSICVPSFLFGIIFLVVFVLLNFY